MSKSKKKQTDVEKGGETGANLRLDPERRVVPQFDSTSVKKFRAPEQNEMGVRVLDNCAEEHQM